MLFFLRAINYDRIFECLLRELLARGHAITVALDMEKQGLPPGAAALFDSLARENPRFSYELLPRRRDNWLPIATRLRLAIDYLRYLEPEYAHADALRERARTRAPGLFRVVLRLPGVRGARGRAVLDRLLRRVEAALPTPPAVLDFIRQRRPDVVLIAPLVGLGSPQGDYVRAAAELGIPTVLPVASWDNLTNKGLIRDVPTLTIVWNDAQVQEATRLHRVPRDRVVAVGAHTYDHWFRWRARGSVDEFIARCGLASTRPFFLYVCSSRFVAGDEVGFVSEWVRRLRTSGHASVREVGVLIRPHPQNTQMWQRAGVLDDEHAVVWPAGGAAPTDEERKADYFNSISFSTGVVGINTSALIEAAIARRPVFTILTDHFRGTQEGTLHFSHLAGVDGGGLLNVARSWKEHLDQLAEALERPDIYAPRIERFLTTFVRPHGLDDAAAPLAADIVERTAAEVVAPAVRDGALTTALIAIGPLAGSASRGFSAARKRVRGLRRRSLRVLSSGVHLVVRARPALAVGERYTLERPLSHRFRKVRKRARSRYRRSVLRRVYVLAYFVLGRGAGDRVEAPLGSVEGLTGPGDGQSPSGVAASLEGAIAARAGEPEQELVL